MAFDPGVGVRVFLKMGYGKSGWVMGKSRETKEMRRSGLFRLEVLGQRR
jgi:hypothetical protein